ncbi:hypothetical protein IP91_00207 [Pseudoduganella lurida]|uniref:Uncharacterized protein n=2 Tax=Pseudoduganella lurida TaxID=1036180 RepID=A0A562RJD5_9BURK|nr:hypothetical protein IP91_00207 [Pseudoduganella lurida]
MSLPMVAGAQPVSEAETLLFETDHLASLKPPAHLAYTFRHVASTEESFDDQVQLDAVRAGPAGPVRVTLRFLSGARQWPGPALDDPHGNPVLLGFLERDIAEMHRMTGGAASYFRRQIRLALAAHATVSTQSFTFGGKSYQGRVIVIQPYRDTALPQRLQRFVHKSYQFVLGDGLPGGIYRIRTSLTAPSIALAAAGGDLLDETLTLDSVADGRR